MFSSYVSPLTAGADIIFPVSNWLEQNGHIVNFDGHILEQKSALEAPQGVYSNEEAVNMLKKALDVKGKVVWEKEIQQFYSPVKVA